MRRSVALGLFVLLPFVAASPAPAAELDSELLAGLSARSIGPAAMSGRVAAIAVVESDPSIVYVGAATGGVWKSVDGAVTFRPIFDDQPVAAIGAVAIFQPSPDLVWVGTGEGNPRNSASVGNGIYQSRDGGRTWRHLGLEKSERIHRIVLHPHDPDIAWVAALGPTWGDGSERGVFKTVDGGTTWQKVLYVDERTGAADLVIDPTNPDHLMAAMWSHRRLPWHFQSGGAGSGLYKTRDGGKTWKKLTPEDGLPEGQLGRIGLAIAASNPRIVYALVEQAGSFNSLLRSQNGGESFTTVAKTGDQQIGNRPFYYADLRVDPRNPDRIFSLWSLVSLSEDGGKTWKIQVPFNKAHPDHHDMWIDPRDSRHLLLGNDGGVYESHDGGDSWNFVEGLPLSQFYHVRYDMAEPFNVYGGLQDNGSWVGPSAVWSQGGIRSHHWNEVHFGDGFDVVPDPKAPGRGWALSQNGGLVYWDLATGERRVVRPSVPYGEEPELRFNWNTAIAVDPFDGSLYLGSQYVHKSSDKGESWKTISPDLTTNKKEWQMADQSGGLTPDATGAEQFTTLIAIAPSPLRQGLIWAGTDDGRVHVTTDGGDVWKSVEAGFAGLPKNTYVPHIEPSRFDPGEAFVVFDDHRRSNWTPYVYKTTDYGTTWKSIATPDLRGYALAIVQDPVDRDLLFLGTEFGLFFTTNGGKKWHAFRHGVPTVSVMDLAIHPRDHALILGTHGRGIFILDDLRPFRDLEPALFEQKLVSFESAKATQYWRGQGEGGRFPGADDFRGENAPYGARIHFWLNLPDLPHPKDETERQRKAAAREKKLADEAKAEKAKTATTPGKSADPQKAAEAKPADVPKSDAPKTDGKGKGPGAEPKAEIVIRDSAGALVRRLEVAVKQGINRAVWDLNRDGYKRPKVDAGLDELFPPVGPPVLPGNYSYTVSFGGQKAEGRLEVVADPRLSISMEDRQARLRAQVRAGELQNTLTGAIEKLQDLKKDIEFIAARARQRLAETKRGKTNAEIDNDAAVKALDGFIEKTQALQKKVETLEKELWVSPTEKGILADKQAFLEVENALQTLRTSWRRPSPTQLAYLERAEKAVATALPKVDALFAEDVAAYRKEVQDLGITLLPVSEPISLPPAQ